MVCPQELRYFWWFPCSPRSGIWNCCTWILFPSHQLRIFSIRLNCLFHSYMWDQSSHSHRWVMKCCFNDVSLIFQFEEGSVFVGCLRGLHMLGVLDMTVAYPYSIAPAANPTSYEGQLTLNHWVAHNWTATWVSGVPPEACLLEPTPYLSGPLMCLLTFHLFHWFWPPISNLMPPFCPLQRQRVSFQPIERGWR